MKQQLSIVIPCKDEAEAIGATIADIHQVFSDELPEIIVVDDGSRDGTGDIAGKLPGVLVVRNERSRGYGEAIKTGIRKAKGDFVCNMDGDGQHRAQDVRRLYENAALNRLVVGRRSDPGQGARRAARTLLRWWSQSIGGIEIHDSNSGLMAFPRTMVIRMLPFLPEGMAYSDSFKLLFHLLGLDVTEVVIEVRERQGGRSKNTATAGIRTLVSTLIMVVLINPTRIFIPVAFGMFCVGTLWAIPFLLMNRGLTVVSLTLLLGSVIFLLFGVLFKVLACISRSLILHLEKET